MKKTLSALLLGFGLLLNFACGEVADSELYLYRLGDYVEAAGTWNSEGDYTFKLDVEGNYILYNPGENKQLASGQYRSNDGSYTFTSGLGKEITVERKQDSAGTFFQFPSDASTGAKAGLSDPLDSTRKYYLKK